MLIIVVLSGEILALVLVKDLSKYKTERHVSKLEPAGILDHPRSFVISIGWVSPSGEQTN